MSTEKTDATVSGNTERLPSFISALSGVVHAALRPTVDPHYQCSLPNRQALSEQTKVPAIQSVNQKLDKAGVELDESHIANFKRAEDVRDYPASGWCDRLRQRYKEIKAEQKIAQGFRNEAIAEQQKGAAADPKKVLYAKTGAWAHTLFGAALAAANPGFAHEDDLGIGSTLHCLDAHNENKDRTTGLKR